MDTTETNTLFLNFEVPTTPGPTLQSQIQQLISQRGALRHITEQTLQNEINQHDTVDQSLRSGEGTPQDESDDESPQLRQEKLWKARDEMLQKLAYAQNEILSALDFVSLLLSAKSSAAQASMSPALKQLVPAGTIEAQTVQKRNISTTNRQTLVRVSEGWKSESFKSVAATFDQAVSRLEREAQRQSKYWEQIAQLKTHGWSISRLPSDSRAIGIHYGFTESSPQFRNRGFALLQQDESDDLRLDPKSVPERYVTTQVTVVRNGKQTGASVPRVSLEQDKTTINDQIKSIRDAIFEEELFYEVSREARLIANQGTRTRPKIVEAVIDEQTLVRISELDADAIDSTSLNAPDDDLAESIAVSMHLLLSLEHSKSKLRRSRRPSPISLTPPRSPEYAILRPILMHLRHQASMSALRATCTLLAKSFLRAGLSFKFRISHTTLREQLNGVERLRQPARSQLFMQLEHGREIDLDVETYLSAPIYGTVSRSHDIDFGFVQLRASSLETIDEAQEYLAHTMTLELISQRTDFTVIRPHSGEVSLKSSPRTRVIVSVRPDRVSLLVNAAEKTAYSWRPAGFHCVPKNLAQGSQTLESVVKTLSGNA